VVGDKLADVAKGDTVTAGQKIVSWNPTEIEQTGYSPICPVIVLEVSEDKLTDLSVGSERKAGDRLFTVALCTPGRGQHARFRPDSTAYRTKVN
jgi:phosphotransferase system IIA component